MNRVARRARFAVVVSGLFAMFALGCGNSATTPTTTTTTTVAPTSNGTVTLNPALLTFTTPTPNVPQTVSVSNTGTGTLTISSVVPSGNFLETDNCLGPLVVGASCTISVTFANLSVGSTGVVTITDDAAGSPQTVSLTGPNITAPADQLTPSSLTFGPQMVGTSSGAQTVTLTNPINGLAAPLTITSIVPVGDFAIANTTCGGSLDSGSSCTISVVFTPSAAGARTGLLAVFDNATNPQHGVPLVGTGQ